MMIESSTSSLGSQGLPRNLDASDENIVGKQFSIYVLCSVQELERELKPRPETSNSPIPKYIYIYLSRKYPAM